MTITEIAKLAGVSHQTVSAVLNNRNNCRAGKETRERILSIARESGYVRSFGYNLMHGQKTRTAAILLSTGAARNEAYRRSQILELMSEFEKREYAVHLGSFSMGVQQNLKLLRDLLQRGCSSFVFLGHPVGGEEMCAELAAHQALYVCSSNTMERFVAIDVCAGCTRLLEHLRSRCGADFRFCCLGGERFPALQKIFPETPPDELKEKFCRQMELPQNWYSCTEDDYLLFGYRNAAKLFQAEPQIKGVLLPNDVFALGFANYLCENGRKIGQDIQLAGFNNDFGVRSALFPISSGGHNLKELCPRLVEAALTPGECRQSVPPEIFIREWSADGKTILTKSI